ncbi:serine acetyltransferase, partial [Candidatus Marinamargulisbacteria bacterium SCGC AG-414-C22]
ADDVNDVILSYVTFQAIMTYRVAHFFYNLSLPLIARVMAEYAHYQTSIDIHPGARIGRYFSIDHGQGIVIGQTAVIGNHVTLYQGVTLGAFNVSKAKPGVKRHPTLEDHVIVYANTTILGGDTVVGAKSVIGANVWLTESVPPQSKIKSSQVV